MKKKLVTLLSGLGLFAVFALPAGAVYAADVLSPACRINSGSAACQGNTGQPTGGNSIYGPNGVLTRAATLVAIIAGIASVIMIIVGGLKYVMSAGDANSVKSAKDTILFALIGILVAGVSQSIVVYVLRRL